MGFDLTSLILRAPAILAGLTVHEFFHGLIAYKLGDPTAKYSGRLTLNPIKHLDPIGTIALFLFHFGWAKPVPINPYYFRNPQKDILLTSLAGPGSNFLLSLVAGAVFRIVATFGITGFIVNMLYYFVFYNLILCIFNLIPIPPLDGSNILHSLLPYNLATEYARLQNYGFLILLGIIFLGQVSGIPILWGFIGPFVSYFGELFTGVRIF